MKFNLRPNRTTDSNDTSLPDGQIIYVPTNPGFVGKAYKEAKGDLDAFQSGHQAGLTDLPDDQAVALAQHPFLELVQATHETMENSANSVREHGLAELDLGLEDLNEAAAQALIESKIDAANHADQAQAVPEIARLNEASANLTHFEISEERGPLGPGSYKPNATPVQQVLYVLLVLGPDALLNALSYASAMPQGLPQAIAIAFFASALMAFCGILFGTGLRYFNIRNTRGKRIAWRCVTVSAAGAALLAAILLTQYRSLLEAAASDGGDAATYSIFTVSPSIVALPVFVGCIIVFTFSVLKFKGGPGTPWATHGDHAMYDRDYREQQAIIHELKERHAVTIEHVIAEGINFWHDANQSERERLQKAKAECAKAKLKIGDLKRSYLKFARAAQPDFARALAGVAAARPHIQPEDFPVPNLPSVEGFPDSAELDGAVAAAEAAFARRTQQLARLEKSLGELATRARQDFATFLARAVRRGERRVNFDPTLHTPKGGK